MPCSRYQVIVKYCSGKKVLDIGCVNHNIENTYQDGWLHGRIKRIAKELVGIDYLESEINLLRGRGYVIYFADITKPVDIKDKFDVIVVGNLIEHLSNHEVFWNNIKGLLESNGVVLISTCNPFYIDQYFYSSFKNRIMINPEHTCWIDPVSLEQLASRFGFETKRVYWISEKWHLGQVICNSNSKRFDILTGTWKVSSEKIGICERVSSKLLRVLFKLYDSKRYARMVSVHGIDQIERLLYIKAVGWAFGIFWNVYRKLIIKSKINEYELFMSVMKKVNEES